LKSFLHPQPTYTFDYSIDGLPQGQQSTTDNPYIIETGTDGDFELIEVFDDNCPGTVGGIASISVQAAPTASISGDLALCEGEIGTLDINLSGNGDWTVEYTLDGMTQPPLNAVSNATILNVSEAGEYLLTSVSDANCPGVVSGVSTVEVFELPSGVLSGDIEICEGEPAAFDVLLTGEGPWEIEVSDGTTIEEVLVSTASYQYPVSTTGNYTLQTITDAHCEAMGTGLASLLVRPLPSGSLTGNPVLCEGEEGTLTVELDGSPGFEFSYSVDGVLQDVITSMNYTTTIPTTIEGDYELVTVSDLYCEGVANGLLSVQSVPLPTAEISGDFLVCSGAEVSLPIALSGTGDWTIDYTINGETQTAVTTADIDFNLLTTQSGLFELTSVTDANCTNVGGGTAEIDVFPPIEVSTSEVASICEGQFAFLDGEAQGGQGVGYEFVWTDSDGEEFPGQSVMVSPVNGAS